MLLQEHKKYAPPAEHNSIIKGLAFMKHTSNSVHQLESQEVQALRIQVIVFYQDEF